jgi:hypothetical protein
MQATNNQASDLANIPNKAVANKPAPETKSESGSLNTFRETIKDVLQEITSLEVNTLIVSNILMTKFDAQEFYIELIENVMYKTENGLQDVKESLLERSAQLKQKGLSLPQQTSAPLLPKEALVMGDYRSELTLYNQDLEVYKEAERNFAIAKSSLDEDTKIQFDLEQSCYCHLAKQLLKLDIKKDDSGNAIPDAQMIRNLRKLWEYEQSVLNGDRIFAQTKFSLDGDLTNRFINDLFMPNKSRNDLKLDPKMSQAIFDLHRQGTENAQKQWSGLIETCVNLVKSLMPFRSK